MGFSYFFKNPTKNFPIFFKTLPNSLTWPYLLPSNFKVHSGKTFLWKIFSQIWVLKVANFGKDFFEFIWITKFLIYMYREIFFHKINFISRPEDYSFSVEVWNFAINLGIFLRVGCLTLISLKISPISPNKIIISYT